MIIIEPNDAISRRVTFKLTEEEWATLQYLNKVFGSTFFETYVTNFFVKRKIQQEAVRGQQIVKEFKKADPTIQAEVLATLKLELKDKK